MHRDTRRRIAGRGDYMKIYNQLWQDIDRTKWPKQGEIFVYPDPQKRLGEATWQVSEFWQQDDREHCDIIGRGLFWKKEDAIGFAEAING